MALSVQYKKHGAPKEVLELVNIDEKFDQVSANEVVLKILGAPVNPSDLFAAEGKYGIQPPLPAVAGAEGVAQVEKVGSGVKSVKVGDWVLPYRTAFGTWRQFAKANEQDVLKVPNDIPMAYAATINVNPSTSYRLIHDFEKLSPGDVIIQNCPTSMVGFGVIQMARELGLRTINVHRSDRPLSYEMQKLMQNLGGDINIPEDMLHTPTFQEILADLPPIKLALNGAGGECVADFARVVGNGASIVTYGMMSGNSVVVPSDLLVYKQLKMRGFWMADWYKNHSKEEASEMHTKLADWIRRNQLTYFYELHDLDDFDYALKKATESLYLRKVVLNCDFPDRLAQHDARPESDYDKFELPVV